MSGRVDQECVHCNAGPGAVSRLEMTTQEGTIREFDLVLCGDCTEAFDGHDWITVSLPTGVPERVG